MGLARSSVYQYQRNDRNPSTSSNNNNKQVNLPPGEGIGGLGRRTEGVLQLERAPRHRSSSSSSWSPGSQAEFTEQRPGTQQIGSTGQGDETRRRGGEVGVNRIDWGRRALTGWMDGRLERRLIGCGIAGGEEGEEIVVAGRGRRLDWGELLAWLNKCYAHASANVRRFRTPFPPREETCLRLDWIGRIESVLPPLGACVSHQANKPMPCFSYI